MDENQKAIIEMQQQMLTLIVRVSCLEELLVGDDEKSLIKKDEYEKVVKDAVTKVNSIVTDKLQAINLKNEEDSKKKE